MKSKASMTYGAIAVAGFCLFIGLAANAAKPDKIEVCHVPADTPDKYRIVQVSKKGTARMEHMLHGDWVVNTEPNCDTIADNDCDREPDDSAVGDAFCDDNDPTTTDSCNTDIGECVNEPIAVCPCAAAWAAVPQDRATWYFAGENPAAIHEDNDGLNTNCQLLSGGLVGGDTAFRINRNSVLPSRCTTRLAADPTNPTIILDLTVEQLNSCGALLDTYATELDAADDVTVVGVDVSCPTFDWNTDDD